MAHCRHAGLDARPPLYPLLLALATELGITGDEALRALGTLTGTITVVLIGLIARRVTDDAVGLLAGAIAAVYPLSRDGVVHPHPLGGDPVTAPPGSAGSLAREGAARTNPRSRNAHCNANVMRLGVVVYFPVAVLAVIGAMNLHDRRRELILLAAPIALAAITAMAGYGPLRCACPPTYR